MSLNNLAHSKSSIYSILTCGVFDVIHAGHINMFKWVVENYDPLNFIVALNTDESLRNLSRAHIHSYKDRLTVLQSVRYITNVIPMNDIEPTNIIKSIRPNIFVKGGDYLNNINIPEYKAMKDIGGELIIYPHKTHSSRGIVEKIRKMDSCRGYHDVDDFYKGDK